MPKVKATPLSKASMSSKFEEINGLIYEYLEINGLQNALQAFATECNAKSIPCPTPNSVSKCHTFGHNDAELLLKCFDDGDLDGFMKVWSIFLNHIQLRSGDDMKKLEVYVRVHFALWPRVRGQSDSQQLEAMAALKLFFEDASVTLANDSTILPLFALPFVGDPKAHPIFHEFMEFSWEQRLRSQLHQTMTKYFELLQENMESYSKLASIVLNSHNRNRPVAPPEVDFEQSNPKMGSTTNRSAEYQEERFFQLAATYRKVRRLLRGTRESYGKLLKVANELIISLEMALNGEQLMMEPILEKCFKLFPELFTSDITSGKPDKEYFKKLASGAVFESILDSDVSLFFVGISDMSPDFLDFSKIKSVLTSDTALTSDKLCLLQSLRWLLTKSTPICRGEAMDSFVQCDLLGLNSAAPPEHREKLFSCMLSPNPTYVKECFARLLNSISSIKAGRSYLASTNYSLKILVQSLFTFKGSKESFICQMVVATLQKLSLRKQMRLGMIEQQVIEWLVVYLKAELSKKEAGSKTVLAGSEGLGKPPTSSYNPYFMEYGWALLMNLCLHDESNGPTTGIAADILNCIVEMLWTKPGPDVAPYVISTLYSLLRNPDIFALAKSMHLKHTFNQIASTDTTELSSHLKHLVSALGRGGYDRVCTSGEVDYDDNDSNDPDEFEPEIEVTEKWVAAMDDSTSTGDDLLIRQYMTVKNDSAIVPRTPTPNNKALEKQGVFLRPVTPRKGEKSKSGSISEGDITEVSDVSALRKKKSNTTSRKKHVKVLTGHCESAKEAVSSISTTANPEARILNLNFPDSKQNSKRRLKSKTFFNTMARKLPAINVSTRRSSEGIGIIKSILKTKSRKSSQSRPKTPNLKETTLDASKSVDSPVEVKRKVSGVKRSKGRGMSCPKPLQMKDLLSTTSTGSISKLTDSEDPIKEELGPLTRILPPGILINKNKAIASYYNGMFSALEGTKRKNRAKSKSKIEIKDD